ncbi:peptidoglycan DD-metalloendopeptidase family protein [Saccharothrix saharensis]|uniref:M23 family metallopeptidase n=1 Tax=Saccharothrix saharensis TaxID=571190 RepID=UPI00367B5DC2
MRTLLVLALTATATLPVAPLAQASRPPRFAWPLAPPHRVVRPFEPPATEYAAGHRGVDLAAPPGSPVLAAADAVVVHAGPVADRAVVSLLHPGGLRTTYEPVHPTVHRGQRVRRGTPIGTLHPGHEGCPTEACLHWGALRPTPPRSRTYLDPLHLLANGRVRLLPNPTGPRPAAHLPQLPNSPSRPPHPAAQSHQPLFAPPITPAATCTRPTPNHHLTDTTPTDFRLVNQPRPTSTPHPRPLTRPTDLGRSSPSAHPHAQAHSSPAHSPTPAHHRLPTTARSLPGAGPTTTGAATSTSPPTAEPTPTSPSARPAPPRTTPPTPAQPPSSHPAHHSSGSPGTTRPCPRRPAPPPVLPHQTRTVNQLAHHRISLSADPARLTSAAWPCRDPLIPTHRRTVVPAPPSATARHRPESHEPAPPEADRPARRCARASRR